MGVYVNIGILLGIVFKNSEKVKHLIDDQAKVEDIQEKLGNVIKLSSENDARAYVGPSNPYNPQNNPYYVGIFYEWSNRRALHIDELWMPEFIIHPKSQEMLTEEKSRMLSNRVYETLQNYMNILKPPDIQFYQVRLWS